jgi:hypothetical protein
MDRQWIHMIVHVYKVDSEMGPFSYRCPRQSGTPARKRVSFVECFPYVCPEPVLAKRSHLCINGKKRYAFFYLGDMYRVVQAEPYGDYNRSETKRRKIVVLPVDGREEVRIDLHFTN